MRRVIGCCHFDDDNMAKIRGFASASEMNTFMETAWKANVSEEDLVYILGDFSTSRPSYWNEHLPGKKILIMGNHDHYQAREAGFISVHDTLIVRLQNGRDVDVCFMSHYPHLSWPERGSGSVHLHAHCHGQQPLSLPGSGGTARLDMSAELWGYSPKSLDEIINLLKRGKTYG